MSILASLRTGVSGLAAQGEALSVIGDNIANANTTGFKASRAEFQDIVAKSLKGLFGGNQIGRGVKLGAVNPILSQGNIDSTESTTDLAISGSGYFMLNGEQGPSYTRDGAFHFNKSGALVNNDNQRVQGFSFGEDGRLTNKLVDIKFPRALTPAEATKEIKMNLNLDSRSEPIEKPWDPQNPDKTSHFSTGVEIYDSQGNKHFTDVYFRKDQDRQWSYYSVIDGKEVVGQEEGKNFELSKGKLTFTSDGKLMDNQLLESQFNFTGGAELNQKIKFNFGSTIKEGSNGLDGTKQYGKTSDVISWSQDGNSAGTIMNFSFDDSGVLTALYSNGEAKNLFRVGIAKFESSESLFKIGNNRFRESIKSGTPSIGNAGEGGRGKVFAKSLERSTVDLALEFVNMIQNQRGFQANSKIITTTDELLGEIINMKR